jgi:hypothetical protein
MHVELLNFIIFFLKFTSVMQQCYVSKVGANTLTIYFSFFVESLKQSFV